ncbi:MAG: aldehyde dehydrogenase family protein, partial [Actinomycetota bacterium]
MNRIGHWINNKVVLGTSGRSGVVFNPATGEEQAKVDFASVAEMDAVVAASKAALPGWRATSLSRRAEIMFRLRELVDANRKEIANIVSLEHGKVPADAMGELARGLENLEFACGIPALLKGGYSEQAANGVDVYSIRQPLGVVAGITPFNFPAMVPMWMFANAIMCGNTFVLKPSEKDPSASMFVADLLRQAGLPDGVFNVVHGDKVAGNLRKDDCAVRGFTLEHARARVRVILRVGLTTSEILLNEHVNGNAILGVHHDHRAVLCGGLHRAKNLAVVAVEHARVR